MALSALHEGFNGTLFAMALSDEIEENADPWPMIDSIFSGNRNPPKASPDITEMFRKRWRHMKQEPLRLDFLKLLARMEMTKDQAIRALEFNEKEILDNPYRLFEEDRTKEEPISFNTVEQGLYPGEEVAVAHPLPRSCDPALREYDNVQRLRAVCVKILEENATRGHTLSPMNEVKGIARNLPVARKIPLDEEIVDICRDDFDPIVSVVGNKNDMTIQLDRYAESKKLLQAAVDERLQNAPTKTAIDWRELVDKKFGKLKKDDKDEERARKEKAIALGHLANSRIAVLIGPAGTGKTTVLHLLLEQREIVGNLLLLLAPTGKARVRLGQGGQTIAQFLLRLNRYDVNTGRYFTNSDAGKIEATTCVVDESSMLTEDMLVAIVDALPPNCRLILVGDPYQLPPIGAGCPFVDIIEYLQHKKNRSGVGELTIPRRQIGEGEKSTPVLTRADVQLAAIFSGRPLPPGEDEIITNAIKGIGDDTVKYRRWDSLADLANLIDKVLAEELGGTGEGLIQAFEESLGATRKTKNEKVYLEFDRDIAHKVSQWQILSVNRNGPGGSIFLNRSIKEQWRSNRLHQSVNAPRYKDWMRFTKPRGPERIVYGDKVICVRNHQREPWIYSEKVRGESEFLANGEIGIVTGQKKWGKSSPKFTWVEFADRSDRRFSFISSDFSEEDQPHLDLAYALTVHKAQGSEFDSVIVVLPSHSRLISREMLYTALTRQKRRIWILHQGSFDRFLDLRQYRASDMAARLTNLFHTTAYKERLIHRTLRGEMVRSKNELVIANILCGMEKGGSLTYDVEPRLPFDDGSGRWADFRVEAKGQIWYWEHCGMLNDKHYRDRWERKKKLYADNGFTIYSDKNTNGRLIVTEDGPEQGLDSKAIEETIQKLFSN
ncbi:MAG: AAA family ATPase [Alphaproteobacteria bacterium]